ncbi:hypothetical protein JA9_004183 [Meyerozyma sp. JA9]|nr:hypothetical protein JA9_004183 [Meyerozyma sp. JA9]
MVNDYNDKTQRIPDKKSSRTLRLVTFNVNGVKTIFNYHPWNSHKQCFDTSFQYLKADIVSLQELKLTAQNLSSTKIGNTQSYRSFVSVPKTKKGYSGVGLFVRIPDENEDAVLKKNLTVAKAEEGLTGYLFSPDKKGSRYRELAPEACIGCYPTDIDDETCSKLDSEGRCISVQLESGLIIFSLYCPANSSGTDEGEAQRLLFLRVLLERCKRLEEKGNEVIIMGDINVALDLIDHADYMRESFKQGTLKNSYNSSGDGTELEKLNMAECIKFKSSTPARSLLNEYVHPSSESMVAANSSKQFLFDTTRQVQKRRLGMYTVWNTLTGARQSNFGSRIDLILTTSKALCDNVSSANIWPFLPGSDHCPVYTDFEVQDIEKEPPMITPLKLETKSHYKLVQHRDISQMFKSKVRTASDTVSDETDVSVDSKRRKIPYVSRKKTPDNNQRSIKTFFFSENSKDDDIKLEVTKPKSTTETRSAIDLQHYSKILYGETPYCKHGELAELKTSWKNPETKGKKFWSCARQPSIDSKCDFFKWAEPKKDA